MSISLKTLLVLVAVGLIMPTSAFAKETSNKEDDGGESTCAVIVKNAHKTYEDAVKSANRQYNDAVDAAELAYIKALRLPNADEAAAKAAKDAAIAAAASQKQAEIQTAYLALSRAIAACPKGDDNQPAPLPSIIPTTKAQVRACVKDVRANTKTEVKSAREAYKALRATKPERKVLRDAKKEMESKIKNLKRTERLNKKICKLGA